MWQDFFSRFAFVSCGASILVATVILLMPRFGKTNRLLALAVIFYSLWTGWIMITYPTSNALFVRLAFTTGPFIPPTLILFIDSFLWGGSSWKKAVGLYVPTLIIVSLIFFTSLCFQRLEVVNGVITDVKFGPLLAIDFLWVAAQFLLLVRSLYLGFRRTSGLKKLQLEYIIAGIGFTVSTAVFVYMILPVLGIMQFNFLGPVLGLPLAVAMAYVSTKHHIWESKVVLSELWALILILVVLTWLIQNVDAFNTIFATAIIVLCGFFIQSTLSEAKKSRELKSQNIQLLMAKKDLEELDRLKDEFLQSAFKEFTMPIKAIQQILTAVLRGGSDSFNKEQQDQLKPVLDATDRLSKMAKDFFDASFLQQDKIWLNKNEVDISELIKKAVDEEKRSAKEKGIKLSLIDSGAELPKVIVDREKVYKVIWHLLENAVKFTTVGEVKIGASIAGKNIEVNVEDTGIGIVKEEQKKLFTKFYRSGQYNDSGQSGIGLGLYISKNIIELHGGSIKVESGIGKGSKFTIVLPLKPQQA